jgi:hypothetical protein
MDRLKADFIASLPMQPGGPRLLFVLNVSRDELLVCGCRSDRTKPSTFIAGEKRSLRGSVRRKEIEKYFLETECRDDFRFGCVVSRWNRRRRWRAALRCTKADQRRNRGFRFAYAVPQYVKLPCAAAGIRQSRTAKKVLHPERPDLWTAYLDLLSA